MLWEIGDDGRDVKELRQQLDLDSGYLSRLLRSLEAAGLVTVGPSPADGRVRTARLTAAGRAERAVLDRRSDELAGSLLEPLSAGQRERLVGALRRGRAPAGRRPGGHRRDRSRPARGAARACRRTTTSSTGGSPPASIPARARPTAVDDMRPPAGAFLVATRRGEPLGCGALKFHPDGVAELKRLWVDAAARASGSGGGWSPGWRSTRRPTARAWSGSTPTRALTEAIALYRERRVPRGPGVQRRGLRRPLVREAPGRFPRGIGRWRDRSRGGNRGSAGE